jgi:hypothetical protein
MLRRRHIDLVFKKLSFSFFFQRSNLRCLICNLDFVEEKYLQEHLKHRDHEYAVQVSISRLIPTEIQFPNTVRLYLVSLFILVVHFFSEIVQVGILWINSYEFSLLRNRGEPAFK